MSYFRVSILGTMVGSEVWSVNPTYDPFGEFGSVVNQAQLDAAATAIANRSIPTNMINKFSSSCARTGARVEVRDDVTDALLAISTQNSTTAASGAAAMSLPPQSALVVSLRTDTPGGSGRGRLYWPCLATSLDAAGKVNSTTILSFMTDMKAYLAGIKNDLAGAFPAGAFDLAVRFKTTHTTPHVTRLQVGNVIDTQRRRRDNLPEAYQTTTLP